MTEASTVAMVGALVYEHRQLLPVLAEHLEDNDCEVLPHLLLADIVRWTAARVETAEETCRAVWQWIARAYEVGDEPVRGLITVSGVEALPNPGEPGAAELRQMLSAELLTLDPWRP